MVDFGRNKKIWTDPRVGSRDPLCFNYCHGTMLEDFVSPVQVKKEKKKKLKETYSRPFQVTSISKRKFGVRNSKHPKLLPYGEDSDHHLISQATSGIQPTSLTQPTTNSQTIQNYDDCEFKVGIFDRALHPLSIIRGFAFQTTHSGKIYPRNVRLCFAALRGEHDEVGFLLLSH